MTEMLWHAASQLVDKRQNDDTQAVSLHALTTLSDAYAVQDYAMNILGAKVAGWKASLLPDGTLLSAPIFDCDVFRSGQTLPIERRIKDGVECELAFAVDSMLGLRTNGRYTASDVVPRIGGAMAAFETLNSRLVDAFQSPLAHLLADNLGNGGVVLGAMNTAWQSHDFVKIPVCLTEDATAVLSKNGGHPVGDPFDALIALANHLADREKFLEPGQFVITGSYTGVRKIGRGQKLTGTFAGFESVILNAY